MTHDISNTTAVRDPSLWLARRVACYSRAHGCSATEAREQAEQDLRDWLGATPRQSPTGPQRPHFFAPDAIDYGPRRGRYGAAKLLAASAVASLAIGFTAGLFGRLAGLL
jgi:hypothetical protein